MMLLLDIGNTNLKYAVYEHGELSDIQSQPHAQDFNACLSSMVEQWPAVEKIWVANVAGEPAIKALTACLNHRGMVQPQFVTVMREQCGIKNAYQPLNQLGVDRWLTVLAARSVCPQGNVIVIDIGTAVKVEALNQNNQFLGGAIAPGFQLMRDSLVMRAPGIHDNVQVSDIPSHAIGDNTSKCVNAGVYYAVIGAIERLVLEMKQQLRDENAQVLITGGGARHVMPLLNFPVQYELNLVIRGLLKVAQCE